MEYYGRQHELLTDIKMVSQRLKFFRPFPCSSYISLHPIILVPPSTTQISETHRFIAVRSLTIIVPFLSNKFPWYSMPSLPSPWSSSTHPEGCRYILESRALNKLSHFLEELEKFSSVNSTVPGAEAAELVLQLDKRVADSYRHYLIQSPDDGASAKEPSPGPFSSMSDRRDGLYLQHVEFFLLRKNKRGLHCSLHWVFPLLTQALVQHRPEDRHGQQLSRLSQDQVTSDVSPLKRHWPSRSATFKWYVSQRYSL